MTDRDDAWRRARRAAAKRHHPDRGGDPAALHDALTAVDREFGRSARPARPVLVVRRSRRGRVRRWATRLARRAAARRPGATRWIDL
ncbi:hypothetical protein [Nocardioides aequoreus]|uniref:hypothetical protein n=1 Tax=Nocardioides aequoreus TaxID=397278 RepID=UPI0004C2DA7B|nr:hypothetical protein [Nocardioides aequoreus]